MNALRGYLSNFTKNHCKNYNLCEWLDYGPGKSKDGLGIHNLYISPNKEIKQVSIFFQLLKIYDLPTGLRSYPCYWYTGYIRIIFHFVESSILG